MQRTVCLLFGLALLVAGLLGFAPGITNNEMLFGIFHVNTAHNIVHVLSGVIALYCSIEAINAQPFLRIFGILYGIVAVAGLFVPHGYLFGLLSNNPPDIVLHFLIAGAALYFGYLYHPHGNVLPKPI